METITNVAATVTTAASRAIWGEGTNPEDKKDGNETLGKEPVAGELGDVKSGEPYDKGNDENLATLPTKSTLTSNPKPATTEPTTDSSAAAVLLPESESESGETPTNLLTTADKAKLPSTTSDTDSKPLTFTKTDPASGTSAVDESKTESLEEKASAVSGTTGFDEKSPENNTAKSNTTSTDKSTSGSTALGSSTSPPPLTGAPKSSGLREENVGSTGLLEEQRIKPESASEPKVGETSTGSSATPKKSLDGSGSGHDKEKKSLKEKIKEKLHRHKE